MVTSGCQGCTRVIGTRVGVAMHSDAESGGGQHFALAG